MAQRQILIHSINRGFHVCFVKLFQELSPYSCKNNLMFPGTVVLGPGVKSDSFIAIIIKSSDELATKYILVDRGFL